MPQFEFFCFRWTGLGWSGRGSGRVDLHDFNYSPAAFLLFDLDQHCRTGRDANITRRLEHRDVQKGIANTFKFNETELLVQFEPAYSTARSCPISYMDRADEASARQLQRTPPN